MHVSFNQYNVALRFECHRNGHSQKKREKKEKNPQKRFKKKERLRGQQGHRPQNTARPVSEMRFHIVFMIFIFHIVATMMSNSSIHMCRTPREIIIEQGLHPNPGPKEALYRRLTKKTKPDDIRKAAEKEDDKGDREQKNGAKIADEDVDSGGVPLTSTDMPRAIFTMRVGDKGTKGGDEEGQTKSNPKKNPAPIPSLKAIFRTGKRKVKVALPFRITALPLWSSTGQIKVNLPKIPAKIFSKIGREGREGKGKKAPKRRNTSKKGVGARPLMPLLGKGPGPSRRKTAKKGVGARPLMPLLGKKKGEGNPKEWEKGQGR